MNNYESSETLNSTYSRTTSCICHCWYCGWEQQSLLNRYKYLQNCTIECDFSLRTNVNRLHHGLDIILGQTQTQLFHRVSKPTEVSLQFHSLIHSFVHSLKAKYDKNKGYSFFFWNIMSAPHLYHQILSFFRALTTGCLKEHLVCLQSCNNTSKTLWISCENSILAST